MLRVSEFCRGPLSPVPSSDSRSRQKTSSEGETSNHKSNNETNDIQELNDLLSTIHLDTDGINCDNSVSDECEDICCDVQLLPLGNVSSSVARVPLDVMKELSLQDGDYAMLESFVTAAASRNQSLHRNITLLQKVVVRLELMDEEEEMQHIRSNLCLVPPIVLANLGISPNSMWYPQIENIEEAGVAFRLRAICNVQDDSSDDEDTSNGRSSLSPWNDSNRRSISPANASTKRRWRKYIAGRVLLRPLGRTPLWPFFALTPKPTTLPQTNTTTQSQTLPTQNGTNNSQPNQSLNNLSSTEKSKKQSTEAATTPKDNNQDEETDENAWIYPSRSGFVLQESTLCEVRYRSKNNNRKNINTTKASIQESNVCYYEVLRIEKAKENSVTFEDDEDPEIEVGGGVFYVTGHNTQFELDSRPLLNLSHVRRLPIPLCVSSKSHRMSQGDKNHSDKGTTLIEAEESKKSPETQAPAEKTNEPLVTPRKLFTSSQIESNLSFNDTDDSYDEESDETGIFCHPDFEKIAKALLEAPSLDVDYHNSRYETNGRPNHLSSTSRILHLVGTDRDNDVQACVARAASMVGMQCLSVRGLAAFGYEYRRRNHKYASQSGVTVRSAYIEQQLAGIDAALHSIANRRMEPCVLHFYDVDEELASVSHDDQLRCQIEDRFWSKWVEGVKTVTSRIANEIGADQLSRRHGHRLGQSHLQNDEDGYIDVPLHDRLDYRFTPRILIVISTKAPLKKGPWLERLIFPSISLSLPDDKYIRYLWNTSGIMEYNDYNESDGKNENTFMRLTKETMPLLRGRPAQEIVQLKNLVSSEISIDRNNDTNDDDGKIHSSSDDYFHFLEKHCKICDSNRRAASSDVVRISNVSWEDVGGLDHVRSEILDAIELPLKYPHLFPPNTGRLGILLFGPPGTGKTLVAKAVATECGLPFLSIKGPELLGSYIGESEANIRKVFSSAKLAAENNRPVQASILFFDELDSLAPKRGGNSNHGGGVMERVVASLLAELDGGSHQQNNPGRVFVLGATNRPDLLDPSLLRPGRLDRLVYLGIPTSDEERTRVLASQLRNMKLEGDAFEMARLVIKEGLPPRLSGADMSKLSSGAMQIAIRRLCEQADQEREKLLLGQHIDNDKESKPYAATMDEILERWGDEKCTPVITVDDLRQASKDVSPSVSVQEMQRYERLRIEHETSSANRTAKP